MNDPLVSIIIPTYNYGKYLSRAIESCLRQSYKQIEIIVIDDGSSDDTRQIVARYTDVVYLFQQNQGVSVARNTGLLAARGDFVAFLDADDYLLEDSISIRIDAFRKHPEVGIVFTDTCSEDITGQVSHKARNRKDAISDRFYEDLLLTRLRFQTSAVMIRSSLAKSFSFVPHLSNGEDIVYFAKVLFAAKGLFCAVPTVVNLHHEDSLRHDVKKLLQQKDSFLAAIFDDPFYKGAIEYMRKEVSARRHMEIFRRLYRSGQGKEARKYYREAVSIYPRSLLNINYLSKLIRSYSQ